MLQLGHFNTELYKKGSNAIASLLCFSGFGMAMQGNKWRGTRIIGYETPTAFHSGTTQDGCLDAFSQAPKLEKHVVMFNGIEYEI